jgi:hypothetical protein
MTINVTMKPCKLDTKTSDELYSKLMQILCPNRGDIVQRDFEPDKEYTFEGPLGTVTVIFERLDFHI